MTLYEEVSGFIEALSEVSGIGICFYDLELFFKYGKTGIHTGHYCDFCVEMHRIPGGRTLCEFSDKKETVDKAKALKEPFFKECYAGISELAVPIYFDGRLRGIVFVGQCRIKDENQKEKVESAVKKLGGSEDELCALYDRLPETTRSRMLAVGGIIQSYFNNLSNSVHTIYENEVIERVGMPLCDKIASHIDRNFRGNVSPSSIGKAFHLNSAYLCRVFKAKYGMPIGEYITEKRISEAKRLLVSSDISVSSVAVNVGIPDVNYFCRVFKKKTGQSAEEYRQKSRT